jgi:hypothetical protein
VVVVVVTWLDTFLRGDVLGVVVATFIVAVVVVPVCGATVAAAGLTLMLMVLSFPTPPPC